MRMNKSQAPQRLSPQRIVFECRNKYPLRISDNHMGNIPRPADKNTDLAVYFMGDRCKVSGKLRADEFAMELSPVNPFESIQITCFKT